MMRLFIVQRRLIVFTKLRDQSRHSEVVWTALRGLSGSPHHL